VTCAKRKTARTKRPRLFLLGWETGENTRGERPTEGGECADNGLHWVARPLKKRRPETHRGWVLWTKTGPGRPISKFILRGGSNSKREEKTVHKQEGRLKKAIASRGVRRVFDYRPKRGYIQEGGDEEPCRVLEGRFAEGILKIGGEGDLTPGGCLGLLYCIVKVGLRDVNSERTAEHKKPGGGKTLLTSFFWGSTGLSFGFSYPILPGNQRLRRVMAGPEGGKNRFGGESKSALGPRHTCNSTPVQRGLPCTRGSGRKERRNGSYGEKVPWDMTIYAGRPLKNLKGRGAWEPLVFLTKPNSYRSRL